MVERVKAGATVREAAAAVGIPKSTAARDLKSEGISLSQTGQPNNREAAKELRAAGKTQVEIAAELGARAIPKTTAAAKESKVQKAAAGQGLKLATTRARGCQSEMPHHSPQWPTARKRVSFPGLPSGLSRRPLSPTPDIGQATPRRRG